jgi:2-dehydro-3-deoxygluconokinase
VERRSAESNFKCYFYRSTSAATNLCPEDVDEDYVAQAKVVYPEGILLYASDSARRAVERLFEVAVKHNRIIIFDPNLRLTMMGAEEARSMVIPLMQKATYVLPGADELMKIMDKPDLDAAIARAHGMGIHNIIIKASAAGKTDEYAKSMVRIVLGEKTA